MSGWGGVSTSYRDRVLSWESVRTSCNNRWHKWRRQWPKDQVVMSWTLLHAWVIMDSEVNTHGVTCMLQVCLPAMSIHLLRARVPVTRSMAWMVLVGQARGIRLLRARVLIYRVDDRTWFRAQSRYDFELDQFDTHEAEHFWTFSKFSTQRQESQDVRLVLGPTALRQYLLHAEHRQVSAQCHAQKSSTTGQHKPHTEDWTWSKAPTANKAKPQDRRDSRDDKGATSAQRQSELIVQQKSHRAS